MSKVSEGVLDWQGRSVRYVDAGVGAAVVVFPAEKGELFDEMTAALAAHRRVIALDAPALDGASVRDWAAFLAQALAQLGIASFSVIGVGRGTSLALAQAIYTPSLVQRVVLLSPTLAAVQPLEIAGWLGEIKMPTLVMVGTRDRSGARVAGQTCRECIPASHLILVYEAGQDLVADRREACLTPMSEFLERGEGFIVFQESQLIRP